MIVAAHPNWLGSPQHFVAGVVLAAVVVLAARRFGVPLPVAFVLGVGVTSFAEIMVELVEYPFTHLHHLHATAYYDTLADMANTVVGAVAGAGATVAVLHRRP